MIQIWYYDTRYKAGFADVWVWDILKKKAYLFEARESSYVYNSRFNPTCIYFMKEDFDYLETLTYDEFKIKYNKWSIGIEKYESRKKSNNL